MSITTAARVTRLERAAGAELVTWQFVELRQSGHDPDLWATLPDGSDLAALAEHEARQPEHTILVCLPYTGG